MKWVRVTVIFFDKAIIGLAALSGVLIVFLMLGVSADVVLRYFLNSPIPNMQEIAQQALLLITFLSATWLLKVEGHTKIDILMSFLNPRTRAILNTVTSLVGGAVCLVFCFYAFKVVWIDFQRHALVSTELRIPYAAIFLVAPVGYFLLFVQFVRRALAFSGASDVKRRARKPAR